MKKDEFETTLLDLWITTAIPLTAANIRYHTRLPRRTVSKWLDQMVASGELEMDVDDSGQTLYVVPGAERPADGPRTFAERERLAKLMSQVHGSRGHGKKRTALAGEHELTSTALSIAQSARRELQSGRGQGDKSLVASAALSLFFGPLGWLYAGSFREAIPASAAYMLALAILPSFFLFPILGIAMPVSGVAGLVYAWQYNRSGQRGNLFGKDDDQE